MTYDCAICHGVNHASRLHCEYCGTIPAEYSIIKKPSIIKEDEVSTRLLEVHVAFGVERQADHRSSKAYFRTVNLDYYAEQE